MRKLASFLLTAILVVGIVPMILNIKLVKASTITVPDDYPTIQLAVDHANPGDTVFVKAGNYPEYLVVGKSLRVVGENRSTVLIGNGTGTGITCEWTDPRSNVELSGFTVENYSTGIVSSGSGHDSGYSGFSVFDNSFTGNDLGACIDWYGAGSIVNNTFSDNIESIYVGGRNGDTAITGNVIVFSVNCGIRLSFESYGNATGNFLRKNRYGFMIMGGCIFGIENNTLSENDVGVLVQGELNSAYDRATFAHNNFLNNTQQAVVVQSSEEFYAYWDAGYPLGGNYWSDYNGEDFYCGQYQNSTGSDCFGDTPYFIDGSQQDNFPAMEPISLTTPPIPSPFPPVALFS
jgi:nitrous oxidase accessory protein NosD